MSRGDEWDDEPRERRERPPRDYDEDEYYDDEEGYRRRRSTGARSGAVTAIGVINIIFGALTVLAGFCMLLGGAGVMGMGADLQRQGMGGGGGVFAMAGGLLFVFALLAFAIAALYITSGVGVLNRRNWARIVTLVLGGLAAVFGVCNLIQLFGGVAEARAPGAGGQVAGAVIGLFVNFGYAVLVYVVLLNADYAREFE